MVSNWQPIGLQVRKGKEREVARARMKLQHIFLMNFLQVVKKKKENVKIEDRTWFSMVIQQLCGGLVQCV